jgi:hypothetical protein
MKKSPQTLLTHLMALVMIGSDYVTIVIKIYRIAGTMATKRNDRNRPTPKETTMEKTLPVAMVTGAGPGTGSAMVRRFARGDARAHARTAQGARRERGPAPGCMVIGS